MSHPITIVKGGTSFTGKEDGTCWTVRIPGKHSQKAYSLKEAKAYAVAQGASGKWNRSIEKTGVRGKGRVTYTDAKGGA